MEPLASVFPPVTYGLRPRFNCSFSWFPPYGGFFLVCSLSLTYVKDSRTCTEWSTVDYVSPRYSDFVDYVPLEELLAESDTTVMPLPFPLGLVRWGVKSLIAR